MNEYQIKISVFTRTVSAPSAEEAIEKTFNDLISYGPKKLRNCCNVSIQQLGTIPNIYGADVQYIEVDITTVSDHDRQILNLSTGKIRTEPLLP
jgi:hypothetical protein